MSRTAAQSRAEAFPHRSARTRRFTLGVPRSLRVRADGRGVLFLRAAGPEDPTTLLWTLDLPEGQPRCVIDPTRLAVDDADLPAAERTRRERARETAGGVVAYATDAAGDVAVAALGATAVVAHVDGAAADGDARQLALPGPVTDPRPDPTGTRVAWVRDDALWVARLDGSEPTELAGEADPAVSWGLAEFVAAEEMGRRRGYWWAPDGRRLLAARVDVSPVATWHLADPARPWQAPQTVRYPAAGRANAAVTLAIVDVDGSGGPTPVDWDRDAWPYLAAVDWRGEAPLVAVQSRDQRRLRLLDVDPASGATRVRVERHDPRWVELVGGLPRRLPDGRALHAMEHGDDRRLGIDGEPVGPPDVGLRRLVGVDGADAVIAAVEDDPTATPLWRVPLDGGHPERLTAAEGVHDGAAGDGVTVIARRELADPAVSVHIRHAGGPTPVASLAATPGLAIRPRLARLGERELAAALLLPQGHEPGDGPLPVLLDPYGGPHVQRVVQAAGAFATSQWFAEQGFAVLVVDGRGSPGRGRAWEQAVAGDLATAPLADQSDALAAADARWPHTLDRSRVAIRGWSFGGFLAAQAVLRRPEVFHAAVAGAPVTEWRWYDTHYTERYLGQPDADTAAYDACGLLGDAAGLRRPLLLIHGLADDNVVAAHTLQLSAALLAAGARHQVLPLTGVTHLAPAATVAANLLAAERDFLADALA